MLALKLAAEAHDRDAAIATFADNIVVRSPITQRIRFEGIDEVRFLFTCVFEVLSDLEFYETVGEGERTQVIFWRGRVDGHYLEEANLLRLNADGQIEEMTVFMRPVPGLLVLVSRLGSALARRRGPVRALAVRWAAGALALIYRLAEPAIVALISAGVRVSDTPPPFVAPRALPKGSVVNAQ